MILSMTGFGKGRAQSISGRVGCDIKSVNHRFLEINIRLPKEYIYLEGKLREWIGAALTRGRIDAFFSIENLGETPARVVVDEKLSAQYLRALKKLKKAAGLGGEISLQYLSSLPGVVKVLEDDAESGPMEALVEAAIRKALDRLVRMRKTEGKALKADIQGRCAKVKKLVKELEKQVPKIQAALVAKVKQRIKDLTDGLGADQDRITQEAAFLAMKADVSEELSRLGTHVEQIDKVIKAGGGVGRKLDFLLQESNREITTCSNKIQSMEISRLVIEIKAELEKMREQAQNVE